MGQDQSTVAERAETTVAECFLTNCVRARFLIDSHTMPGQRHISRTPTSFPQALYSEDETHASQSVISESLMHGAYHASLRVEGD